jgi:putative aminopeptidase FrvX
VTSLERPKAARAHPGNGIDRDLLLALAAAPTAPFREHRVVSLVRRTCERHPVPFYQDPDGNLILGVTSGAALSRAIYAEERRPLLVFSAHMDHPGFHGLRWRRHSSGQGAELEVLWMGGAPRGAVEGAPVWIADTGLEWTGSGRMLNVRRGPASSGGRLLGGIVSLDGDALPARTSPHRLYGGFRFRAPCWLTPRRLYGRSLDDLAGVYALLDLARAYLAAPAALDQPPSFIVLLTRAEEVAFVGMLGHLERARYHRARRPVRLINVEATRSTRGARAGRGVVVRLGDRATVFDPATVATVSAIADSALDGRSQQALTGATTCEASVALSCGLPSAGLAIAVGNHHNERSRDLGVAPEYVDLGDLADLGRLCRALVAPGCRWDQPFADRRRALAEAYEAYRDLLTQDGE